MRFIALMIIGLSIASSAWASANVNSGVPVADYPSAQSQAQVVGDGTGGAFVAWVDDRLGISTVWLQHLNQLGAGTWSPGGIQIASVAGQGQNHPMLAVDGAGGVYVGWEDSRLGFTDIMLQRFTSAGVAQWASPGLRVIPNSTSKGLGNLTSDGAGGVLIALVAGSAICQRVNASGTRVWSTTGAVLGQGSSSPRVVDVGGGYFACAWTKATELYAQMVNLSGQGQWAAGGVRIGSDTGVNELSATPIPDGLGGFYVAVKLGSSNSPVVAFRVNAFGSVEWRKADFPGYSNTSGPLTITRVGENLMCVSYSQHERDGNTNTSTLHARLQGITPSGQFALPQADMISTWKPTWPPEPSVAAASSSESSMVAVYSTATDVYALRVDQSGALRNGPIGTRLTSAPSAQSNVRCVAKSGGGVHVLWDDNRYGTQTASYYQQLSSDAQPLCTDPDVPVIHSATDVPADEGGTLRLSWSGGLADRRSVTPPVASYTVYRAVPAASTSSGLMGKGEISLTAPAPLQLGGEMYYWEQVSACAAAGFEGYSAVVQTVRDSSVSGPANEYYLVRAWEAVGDDGGWWDSQVATGHSVDNIAPSAPSAFSGVYNAGQSLLTWARSASADVALYQVYRAPEATFSESEAVLVYEGSALQHADASGAPSNYFIRAVDQHGNRGVAIRAALSGVAAVGNGIPTAFAVSALSPNPAARRTTLALDLPSNEFVEVSCLDVQGRTVASLPGRVYSAGSHSITIELGAAGRALPAGMYWVRVSTRLGSLTRRVVVGR